MMRLIYRNMQPVEKIAEAGAISCGDMTLEASLTKMMWLLSQHKNNNHFIKTEYQKNLAGEITE